MSVENRSKKINIPIFSVLNMFKPPLDEENRTLVTFLRWLPSTMRIHTKSNGLFQKKSKPNRWQGWGRHGISEDIEEHGNSRGQLKQKWNFHRSVHEKVMWNDQAVIRKMFGCLVLFASFKFPNFKFPKICGAEERTYLNSSHKFIQCNSFLKCTCDIG